jgi:hypothetical protein
MVVFIVSSFLSNHRASWFYASWPSMDVVSGEFLTRRRLTLPEQLGRIFAVFAKGTFTAVNAAA